VFAQLFACAPTLERRTDQERALNGLLNLNRISCDAFPA
jgi:hypothetical protein